MLLAWESILCLKRPVWVPTEDHGNQRQGITRELSARFHAPAWECIPCLKCPA